MIFIEGAGGPGGTWRRNARIDRGTGLRRRILEVVARYPAGASVRLIAQETGLDLDAVRDQVRYLKERGHLVAIEAGGGAEAPRYRAA